MQQRYRSKFHKNPFYWPSQPRRGSYDFNRLVSMLRVAGKQVEGVGK